MNATTIILERLTSYMDRIEDAVLKEVTNDHPFWRPA